MKTKYFSTMDGAVNDIRKEIKGAVLQIEQDMEDWEGLESPEAIAIIYVGDHAGRYAMRDFTTMFTEMTDEEYEEKYFGDYASEEDIWDFDKLLDDVNEELEEWFEFTGLAKEFVGFRPYITWWEGHIVMMLYIES